MVTKVASLVLCAGLLSFAPVAAAQDDHTGHDHAAHAPGAHGEPGDAANGDAAHGQGHGDAHGGDHHVPTFGDINWFYGVLGEREGVEPSLIYRPKGMPAPFGAYLLNAAILYFILYRFLKKPVSEGLKARKTGILRGMNEASRMQKDAEARLAEYEEKLAHIDDEVERVRREMRESGESERARILAEARSRRERIERDAKLLLEQELAATREILTQEMIGAAMRSATASLTSRVTGEDQTRLAEEYLAGIQQTGSAFGGRS